MIDLFTGCVARARSLVVCASGAEANLAGGKVGIPL
jgi:hypothetical protein